MDSKLDSAPSLAILGTRGIPARHGGFETFAERLALFLASRSWDVTVYCQEEGKGAIHESKWNNIRLVHIPVSTKGALGTVVFDWKSTIHASRRSSLVLTLGYNTAVFGFVYRLGGTTNVINMDGIEWKRQKWSLPHKCWLIANEFAAACAGHRLIADHPEIARHLNSRLSFLTARKLVTIPYGADSVLPGSPAALAQFYLRPQGYALVVARPEPENSLLEIVTGFSKCERDIQLAILGNYKSDHPYHRKVMQAAGPQVKFLGAIYDREILDTLRSHAAYYVHGHQVGGTNPALVEALGAGCAILAHDNPYNRWVAGPEAMYFSDAVDCARQMDRMAQGNCDLNRMRQASTVRHAQDFCWDQVLREYEVLLAQTAMSTKR